MSDFSELCPLFNTGVFHEVTFPYILMTDISATGRGNALYGTWIGTKSVPGFTFGRTVIVTGAYLRRTSAMAGIEVILLNHHASQTASGTEFGSLVVPLSVSAMETATWVAMTVTEKTFTSSEVLGLSHATTTAANGGIYDLMIRYKEK